ncbi:MAG: hypothetical protein ABEK75_07545 [Salinibacter sp.]
MSGDLIFDALLWIHIAAGMVALVVAPGALLTRKGSGWHRHWGQMYFWSMAVVAGTALVMSAMRSGLFLGLVAVFSFYLAFTGVRALRRKRPGVRVTRWDWGAALIALLGSVGLILFGGLVLADGHTFGIVALVFGGIGGGLAGRDLRRFWNPSKTERAWFFMHLQRMIAAYIATVSAFSVVNFSFLPPVVRWLWPTVVGTAAIALWTRYYRRKFTAQAED